MKQLTVFGASGKVGSKVVALALERGYRVMAFVHSHDPFERHVALRVVKGDIHDQASVTAAISGSDAVISTLGSWGTKEKNIVSVGMQVIIPSMERAEIKRLVTLTGAGSFWQEDQPNYIDRLSHALLGLTAPKILRDGEEHLRLLDDSKLDYTCVRSPVMRATGSTNYRLNLRSPVAWATIPRPAVVKCLIDQLETAEHFRSAPFIHKI